MACSCVAAIHILFCFSHRHETTFSVLGHYNEFAVIAQMSYTVVVFSEAIIAFLFEHLLYVVLVFGWASWLRSSNLFCDLVLFVVEFWGAT